MAGRGQIANKSSALIAMIADEDTVTGFLLAGVGNVDLRRKTNYLIVDSKTPVKAIEDAFKEFTTKEDVAIVLISQYVANMIRFLVDSYNKPIPAILEIPSKDHPYDPANDSVLSRVKHLFSSESVASERR
ncbi:V-type proton ATPase subunit F [Melia azedarach]|uniref:V-type proton ATPase subunit F n=1 Tax=Melia azedarach TaxID=155640 RepID=A0ACC1Y9A0_MELAZ|nr:V-type proton ATPase subunit F [Melia azedarach]